jgi:hypothetical protein
MLSQTTDKIYKFRKQLSNHFKVKDLGEVKRILNIRITQDWKNHVIYLDQSTYIKQMFRQLNIANDSKFTNRIPITTQTGLTRTKPGDIIVP